MHYEMITSNCYAVCSSEVKPLLEDKLSDFSASLIAAYDSGELLSALEEGHAGWQKWVKSFGKSLKRKVASLSLSLSYTNAQACTHGLAQTHTIWSKHPLMLPSTLIKILMFANSCF